MTSMRRISHDSKISETALESIKHYILENNLKTGDALPSETELSSALGISRASTREALRSLEALGIIKTLHGKGRFIQEFDYKKMLDNLSYSLKVHVKNFRQIIDVRMALEESFLKKAMNVLVDEDFIELEQILIEMQKFVDEDRPEEDLVIVHTKFHQKLYEKLDNKLLENLIGIFATFQRYLTVFKRYKTSDYKEFIALHYSLIDLIKSKDSSRISEVLEEHFKDVINWSNEHQNDKF